ncbi:MAG: hypothetical protein A2204_00015 [Elusimicrobia bacterium RIFOXYA1_FULL_47_7]|nr:MAG: hypothetical protein A2204_00015 [Elusimicrobia bacterium RIFOXYA1_FULL_47_7]
MVSKVFYLQWNRIDSFAAWLAKIGAADHVRENDFTAIKIHFGEAGNKGFINPDFVKPVASLVSGRKALPFMTDANTIYVGQRADAVRHALVAESHGFTTKNCGCPVIIADGLRGNSGAEVEVNLKHFKKVNIANAVNFSDSLVFMSHFKGHEISGFGGALKNMGMGCGTRAGKYSMHDTLNPSVNESLCTGCAACVKWCSPKALKVSGKKITLDRSKCTGCGECILSCPERVFSIPWDEKTSNVQEKIVEYAAGALKGKRHFSINFINYVTKFCDCYATKENPLLDDIGVMASSDPVALDQACADLVNSKFGADFWKHIFPEIDWTVQLKYAEQIGLGSRKYELEEFL